MLYVHEILPSAVWMTDIKKREKVYKNLLSFLSLLSDSNQRPRDYKSRALAN